MLVQYFLKKYYEKAAITPPAGIMKVDGIYEPITQRWIDDFQSGRIFVEPGVHPMVRDGIVDRVPAHDEFTPIHKPIYTILFLNMAYKQKYPDLFDDLPNLTDLPPLVAHVLKTNGQNGNGPGQLST
jgi:hypothetical protein